MISISKLKNSIDKHLIEFQNQNIINVHLKIDINKIACDDDVILLSDKPLLTDETFTIDKTLTNETLTDKTIVDETIINETIVDETLSIDGTISDKMSVEDLTNEDNSNFLFNSFIHILSDSLNFNYDDWNLIY